MREIKQSTAANVMVFMTDSADQTAGKTGLTLTITASKDGAAFASISPTVTERGNGWYNLALTTTHTNTLGDLALHITATGADPTDMPLRVIAIDKADSVRAGMTALPNAAADAAGGLPISDAGGLDLDGRLDAAITSRLASADITLSSGAVTVGTNNDKTGYTISGTLTTLDSLDTAQDTQHATTQSSISALNDISAADVNAQVDTALADIHLDHLLAVDYDPASKPGIATALLNELVENDAGVSRFTANALEQAPSGGGGGDATAANQTTIISHLTDIKGATWSTTDTLEAIRDRGDAAWVTATGFSTHSAANVRTEMDANSTQLAAILVDTGTTIPAQISALNDLDAGGVRSAVGLAAANLDTQIAALQTDLDTVTDTGVTCIALNSDAIADVWSTDTLTESYAADGAAGTPAQILYLIQQSIGEVSASGTTLTVKQLDGSTTAATYTLDDASTPASRTRAT